MNWNKKEIENDQVRELSTRFDIDLLSASILARRDITKPEELCYFIEKDFLYTHNPFLFVEMEDAVDRMRMAVQEGEKVHIFGDRDVDGITSTVLLLQELRSKSLEVSWSLPMGDEPYGLTIESVERVAENDCTLIITVDCGISEYKEIAYAREKGIDTIVLDHHNPRKELPEAKAIINPKVEDSGYPFKDLAGCAVTAKAIWALRFSEFDMYNQAICLLNVRPGNETFIVEAIKLVNLVEMERITENLVPGVVDLERTRLWPFIQGQSIYVYDAPMQEKMLRKIFSDSVDIHLEDLAPELRKEFSFLDNRSIIQIMEKSRMARYTSKPVEEIDIVVNLFNAFVYRRSPAIYEEFIPLLELVCLGTIADMMPLVDENRILVFLGLKEIATTKRPGLLGLLERQSLLGKKLSTTDLAWQISPLINATGRMGQPDKAVELLLTETTSDSLPLVEEIIQLNNKRKKMGDEAWNTIQNKAKESFREMEGKLVVVYDRVINRGVTGILASRLSKLFHVAAVVLSTIEGKIVGSVRSPGDFEVKPYLSYCSPLFIDWGGHDFAAGFSLLPEHLEDFYRKTRVYMKEYTTKPYEEKPLEIDAELPNKYLTPELIHTVERFEPYGEKNTPLIFLSRKVTISQLDIIGKTEKQHVKLLVDTGKYKWPALLWNGAERVEKDFSLGDKVDIVFRLGRNYFQNTERLQLTLLDISR